MLTVDIDVGGSGKQDFTFEPFGGVAALYSQRQNALYILLTSSGSSSATPIPILLLLLMYYFNSR